MSVEKRGVRIGVFYITYIVVVELIPEMTVGAHSNIGMLMFAPGFTVMMILDIALG